MIKVGRGQRKLGMDLRAAEMRIMNEEGREAHIDELARACGVTSEEAAIALEATTPVVSLSHNALGDDGAELENYVADTRDIDEMERLRDKIAISQVIDKLDPTWRKIIILRYYKNMTQSETASLIGLSQVKISREEKKILTHLRQMLT
jgi:RNA polymerase sporulation-specific sigma factor